MQPGDKGDPREVTLTHAKNLLEISRTRGDIKENAWRIATQDTNYKLTEDGKIIPSTETGVHQESEDEERGFSGEGTGRTVDNTL